MSRRGSSRSRVIPESLLRCKQFTVVNSPRWCFRQVSISFANAKAAKNCIEDVLRRVLAEDFS
jgi:hypothetical protein